MAQSPAHAPTPTLLRQAILAAGGPLDLRGHVYIEAIPNFDLDQTIFRTLEGRLPRFFVQSRIAKTLRFPADKAQSIQNNYRALGQQNPLPAPDPALLQFLVDRADFDVEHADGSFLDHLYFSYEYGHRYFPQHSPLVLFLHSILGTGTNTFALGVEHLEELKCHLSAFEWRQIEAFPSILRLLFDQPLRQELRQKLHRWPKLKAIHCHRVIDNAPITLSADDLWIALQYQLIHFIDFLPAANWSAHRADQSFILFRDLYDLLQKGNQLSAHINYQPYDPHADRKVIGETGGLGLWIHTHIPPSIIEKQTATSVRKFSAKIGHKLDYELLWN